MREGGETRLREKIEPRVFLSFFFFLINRDALTSVCFSPELQTRKPPLFVVSGVRKGERKKGRIVSRIATVCRGEIERK